MKPDQRLILCGIVENYSAALAVPVSLCHHCPGSGNYSETHPTVISCMLFASPAE